MENKNYYVGLDIGTDSVGYAVTDERYELCKFKGEPMWGVTLFDEAELAAERRGYRTARRRLDRRQQRVKLIMDLFAGEIAKIDKDFYKRIKSSYLYPENDESKIRLFGSYDEQKAYVTKYPTVHHLISELMNSKAAHDVRLVYIACAWLVAHRGHFLSDVSKSNISEVTDFSVVYGKLVAHITRDEYSLPWSEGVDTSLIADILKRKLGVTKKSKALTEVLFGSKAPKNVSETYEYNYELLIKLLCGGEVELSKLFGKEQYSELEEKKLSLGKDDEVIAAILASLDEEDAELITALKAIYDWSLLADILRGKETISEAKVAIYDQHKNDLKELKSLVKRYLPGRYYELFRSDKVKTNYVAYIGKNLTANNDVKVRGGCSKEELCKYILALLKDAPETEELCSIKARIENFDFLPKQVEGDNRVIPYQLYYHELSKILENAKEYLPFLKGADEDGITVEEKILSVFEFRVPYFVGPLREKSDRKYNHWMVRKAEGKIYPWNFEDMVDLDKSEEAFIARMTNSCTYLLGEDVLPQNSLLLSAFNVLNEINNIKINGEPISVEAKQELYENVFMHHIKVTPRRIFDYLKANGYAEDCDVISGLDETVKSSLKPFIQFDRLVSTGVLTYENVERIIERAAYSEDKARYEKWLRETFPCVSDSDIKYVLSLKLKGFGRLSKKLLCGLPAVDKGTGEVYTVIKTMWETNCNFMQVINGKFNFNRTFIEEIDRHNREYFGEHPTGISERLDEMRVSNSVKRPIIRTLDIMKDIVKVRGASPKMIFIEMARSNEEKGKRTSSRLAELTALYSKVKSEDARQLLGILEAWGDEAHNKLQSDKLFLYFVQLGKCLYTGKPIDIEAVMLGDGTYNIEHIYPRSFVKDDSVINNKILVDSKANGDKGDSYPISKDIQEKMIGYWSYLKENGLMSDEKFKRLTRMTHFTEDERFEFINRQLVETRQSTKAVASLLGELYPECKIVYVKAGLVSDFRQTFGVLKSRAVNDLHHAKDAYLNIVAGSVWHHKFSRDFWKADESNNAKPEVVFTRPVVCGGKNVWQGAKDKDRAVAIAKKNTAHITKYSFVRKGGFFDQMPLAAGKGQVPRKQDMPIDIYGGYNNSTASFFMLVKYHTGKKCDIMIMPVELLFADKFLSDNSFAEEYAKDTISKIVNKAVDRVEFLLDKRILKINTVLSLNGLLACITRKSSGGAKIGISLMTQFKTSAENEEYIRKLEAFDKKKKKNAAIELSERFDKISAERNIALYEHYIEKLNARPYVHRPAKPTDTLEKGRESFALLPIKAQVDILLRLQTLFGRISGTDLSDIGGAPKTGVTELSSSLSNWKKYYSDVRIIDQSASGLFEKASDNLLELL
ncbi:MAG: type II CRISPR RNA-guided endonuclease Cas9 [Clostridia bacterium]|nr:type II CRISPR RNA-guided endonuclease Cas9 [Clostridia bacterium]